MVTRDIDSTLDISEAVLGIGRIKVAILDLLEELTALFQDDNLNLVNGHDVLCHQMDRDKWRSVHSSRSLHGRWPCVPFQVERLMEASLITALTANLHETCSRTSICHD